MSKIKLKTFLKPGRILFFLCRIYAYPGGFLPGKLYTRNGMIYIATHGDGKCISPCIYYESECAIKFPDEWKKSDEPDRLINGISFERSFFRNKDFSGSLLFMNTCHSWNLRESYWYYLFLPVPEEPSLYAESPIFDNAKVYLGFTKNTDQPWSIGISYYFLRYLIYGYETPSFVYTRVENVGGPSQPDPDPFATSDPLPMSVKEAQKRFEDLHLSPYVDISFGSEDINGCEFKVDVNVAEEIYFPGPAKIIVHKK